MNPSGSRSGPSSSPPAMHVQLVASNQKYRIEVLERESILYAGLRQGLELPYGCATGTCGTCRVRCVAGGCVNAWPEAPGARQGESGTDGILMCQSTPCADTVLETPAPIFRSDPGACVAQHMAGRIARPRVLARDVMGFTLELEAPMSYEAGQFAAIEAPGIPGYRVFSMTTFERGARRLEFVAKRKPGGAFSTWLFDDAFGGSPVMVFGPLGKATFSPSARKDLLIIAGGSGIAGMMAILGRAVQEGYFRRHSGRVFFGVRTWADAFYLDELSAMRNAYADRLSITVALSEDGIPEAAGRDFPALDFACGHVHEVAGASMAGRYANVRAYVAGPPPAVDAAMRHLLREARMPAGEIRYDKFG